VTEKFVEFLAYKATYENVQPNEEIPDFIERIAPEIALELCVTIIVLSMWFLRS
jgi:transcription elongation factor B subunit 1